MICKITGKKIKPLCHLEKCQLQTGLSTKNFKKNFFNMEIGFSKKFLYFNLMIIQNHNKCLIKIIHFLLVVLKEW